MPEDIKIKHKLPKYVLDAAEILRRNNYEAFLVGGSVRDIILGKEPNDYDIATNAYPEDIQKIFDKSIPTGAKFGTMIVLIPDENNENHEIEITTYRSEADYIGGRWPAKVTYTKTIQEDLARRDFTINAIALRLDDNTLENEDIVDPFNGIADLEAKTIRAVGNPVERFSEDGLRALRACRLAANLNFEIESQTFDAIKKTLHITKQVSKERVRDEFIKLLQKSPKPSVGLELMRQSGLMQFFIPELLENIEVTQPEFHEDDVYVHSLKAVDLAEDEVKLAALFHDIAKARTRSEDEKGVHFYGHDKLGAKMTEDIMKRLKFPNDEIKKTATLVRWHMFYYPNADWRKVQTMKTTFNKDISEVVIYVIRHGSTEHTEKKIISGQINIDLNKQGKQQAQAIIKPISNLGIEAIISSPLKRAKQTAEIIASELNLEIHEDARFTERNFGELQDLTWEQFAQQFPDLANHPDNNEIKQEFLPSGESISEIESRVKVGMYNLIKSNIGKTVLLVTHQGVIRIIKRIVGGFSLTESRTTDLGGCEYVKFTVDLQDLDPAFLSDEELDIVRQEQLEGKRISAGGWGDGAIRRFIRNVGGEDMIDDLMKLRIADATANPKSTFNPVELRILAERISKIREEDMAMKVTDLDINGNDLMKIGIKDINIGKTLQYLLEEVTDDPLLNKNEDLLRLAKEYKSKLKQ
jgi:putative nucleotidyltransferase with HDIG domain